MADVDKAQPKPKVLPNPAPIPNGWPAPLKPEALYGISGDVVKTYEPYSEADPAGLVFQNHVAFGNVIGNQAHFFLESDRHACNIYVVEVGVSSKARKGVGWGNIADIYKRIDPKWAQERVQSGVRTGEGLVLAVRDGTAEEPGVQDKRLLLIETELGGTLRVMGRQGNSLSMVLRQGWDGTTLRVLTRRCPLTAAGAYVSMISHTTEDDLSQYLHRTDIFNGYANRNCWTCVRRPKLVPEGARPPETQLESLSHSLKEVVEFSRQVKQIRLSRQARELWHEEYPRLTADVPGMLGAATARSEAQTRRLAAIYALMDECDLVQTPHLRAALALWEFSFNSARFIFGNKAVTSETKLQARICELLRGSEHGLTRTQISAALNNHYEARVIASVLGHLREQKIVDLQKMPTQGRSAERWFLNSIDAEGGK